MSVQNFKTSFYCFLQQKFDEEPALRTILLELIVLGKLFVVGGFVRDFLTQKESRDIDIIVDINNEDLIQVIASNKDVITKYNHHGGTKILLNNFQLDIWSIDDNWAFKNELVAKNDNDILNSIAKGCFYNYDSLVVQLPDFNYNLQYYREFERKKELDILQKRAIYKTLNPTMEANILRALYITKKENASISDNVRSYIQEAVDNLSVQNKRVLDKILETKKKYSKYSTISCSDVEDFLKPYIKNSLSVFISKPSDEFIF